MKLTREQIYVGNSWGEPGVRAIVVGHEFGPCLLYVGGDLYDALDEFDERHGDRVEPNDPALVDCGGIEAALEDGGQVRINSGGTIVWVSDYEWLRTFASVRDAGKFWRGEDDGIPADFPRTSSPLRIGAAMKVTNEMSEQEGRQFLPVSDAIELAQWVCDRADVDIDWRTIRQWWLELGGTRADRITYATVNRLIRRAIAFED